MGTVVKTIGSAGGRDYSTLQGWEDACPANLVTDGNIQQGECYNDSEFATPNLTLGGSTADATHYKHLTAAAGQSFQDNANVRTNALAYNQSNGVGLSATGTYGNNITISAENCVHLSRLQIKTTGNQGRWIYSTGSWGCIVIKDCFVQRAAFAMAPGSNTSNGPSLLINTVFFDNTSLSTVWFNTWGNQLQVIGCSFIRTTSTSQTGTAISHQSGHSLSTNIVQSTCCFGYGAFTSDTSKWDSTNSKNCATELASGFPGSTGHQYSVTYSGTTPFTQASTTNTDLRAIAGTALAANGYRDSTNAPNDISATARASSPTIGHWELVAAVTDNQDWFFFPMAQRLRDTVNVGY